MIALILANGLGFFWPRPVALVTLKDGSVLMGEIVRRGRRFRRPARPSTSQQRRLQLKLGNRDLTGVDFKWVDEDDIDRTEYPADAVYVERREYGPFIGRAVTTGRRRTRAGRRRRRGDRRRCRPWSRRRPRIARRFTALERDEIGGVNYRIEQVRLRVREAGSRRAAESRRGPA